MPLTVSYSTGTGESVDSAVQIQASIQLPDSGTAITVTGTVRPPTGQPVAITPNSLTMPAAPGSGSVYWCISVDLTSGTATVLQSTSSMPSANANGVVVFQQTLVPGNSDPAVVSTDTTPTY